MENKIYKYDWFNGICYDCKGATLEDIKNYSELDKSGSYEHNNDYQREISIYRKAWDGVLIYKCKHVTFDEIIKCTEIYNTGGYAKCDLSIDNTGKIMVEHDKNYQLAVR